MKKLIALILALLMLTGCQLASVEKAENPMEDRLVGVFITFDHMDLDFDIEGWLNDNSLSDGAVIELGEGLAYQEKFPVTVGNEGWIVAGYEGLSIGRYWNGDYWAGFSSEGICDLNSHIASGEEGDTVRAEGTIYFPSDGTVMFCVNPVYQTAEGAYYVVQGNSFQSDVGSGAMSQSVRDEKNWNLNGAETHYTAEFTAIIQGVALAERVNLVWMSEEHQPLSHGEYAVSDLPETLEADGAYLIVEEIVGDEITRSLYQPGDDAVKVFYRGEAPWCLPKFVTIQWPE